MFELPGVFTKSVRFYDAIYSWKDYARESERLQLLLERHAQRSIRTLLDVVCGTGQHLAYLKRHYTVEGLDLDPEMLTVARERCPDVSFNSGDMRVFDLGRRFDAVVCLFSSIAYCRSPAELAQAIGRMATHTNPGGLVIVEPFLPPEKFKPGHLGAVFVDRPDLKIARINTSAVEDHTAVMVFHYLIGSAGDVQHFTERHAMSLFSDQHYLDAFARAGLRATYDSDGLMGRGLYIGIRPD
jgi:SAM-dependent methyltransferase